MNGQKRVVHSFSVWEENNPQISSLRLIDRGPSTNSTVLLDHLLYRVVYDKLNPQICNDSTVRTIA